MFCFNTNLEWVIFVSSYNNWHSKACCWQGSILNLCYWSSVRLDSPETIEYAWNLSWDLELTSHLKQSEWKCLSKAQSFSTVFCPCLGTIGSLENWESKYWFLYNSDYLLTCKCNKLMHASCCNLHCSKPCYPPYQSWTLTLPGFYHTPSNIVWLMSSLWCACVWLTVQVKHFWWYTTFSETLRTFPSTILLHLLHLPSCF